MKTLVPIVVVLITCTSILLAQTKKGYARSCAGQKGHTHDSFRTAEDRDHTIGFEIR